ncbi:hypothetical protein EJB05_47103, partial [Eragrostis curvula]
MESIAEAIAVRPLNLWNHSETQILVLLSLALQVVLVLLAGIRRSEGASPMLRLSLWIAYQLTDSTAIYTIGQLSLSAMPPGHQLLAFWAPFLLLHLGGPDNITAYALQDNQLWLRHLLTLIVQVLGTAYVLYKHIGGIGSPLVALAAILMFAVGVAKYGERTWALRRGNMDSIRSSIKKELPAKHNHDHRQDRVLEKEEFQLRQAHSSFHVCKRAIVDSSEDTDDDESSSDNHDTANTGRDKLEGRPRRQRARYIWSVAEMELSLMYDILYTKAAVIHTWLGYCLRLVSPLTIAASTLLFHFAGHHHGHSRVDIIVTYILLAGALLLETTSLMNALGSTWTFAFLYATRWTWLRYTVLCSGRWDKLRHAVVSLRRRVRTIVGASSATQRRRWSGKMGQYNMLHLCIRARNKSTGPLLGRIARLLGFKELWDTKHYSGKILMSRKVKSGVNEFIDSLYKMNRVNALGVLRATWIRVALRRNHLEEELGKYIRVEFQEGVIIWHIATDIFLARSSSSSSDNELAEMARPVRAISNYMMFLLVDRPHMLPGLSQSRLYQQTCNILTKIWDEAEHTATSSDRRAGGGFFPWLKDLFRLRDDPNSYSSQKQREKLAIALSSKEARSIRQKAPRLSFATSIATP